MNKLKKDNVLNFPSKMTEIEREVEAIVFAAAEPLSIETIETKISKNTDVLKILQKLQTFYTNRGINLVCISNKWSFRTAQNLSSLMSQQKTVEKKLSKAAIETLAIIVYHQPVTRAEIEEIRGVAFGTNTLEILMELNWVKPQGRKDIPGKPIQYGTTDDFLSHFNLQKLSDLPTVDELGTAGLIDTSSVDASIFGTGKFYKEKQEDNEAEESVDAVDTAKAELDTLVNNEATLSEEFKEKTAVIFEAAVKSKLSDEIDRLETQYKEELAEEVSSTKSELVEKVDSYLNYVVENWIKENEIAIENGLRTEIAEGFMDKLKDLFTESYIQVPESKVDLVDELAEQVEELETKLNETTQKVIDQSGEIEEMTKDRIINESASDLADTQVEKLKSLVNDLDFENEEKFKEKVDTIKEAHFSQETGSSDESPMIEEDGHDEVMETSPNMERYVSTLKKTVSKN